MKSTLLVFASLLVCFALIGGCNHQEGKTLTCIMDTELDPTVVPVGASYGVASTFVYTGYVATDLNSKALIYHYDVISGPAGAVVNISPGAHATNASGGAGTIDASTTPPIEPSCTLQFNTPGTYVMRLTMAQANGFISATSDHTYIATPSSG